MSSVRCAVWVDSIVGITVVGNDEHLITVGLGCLAYVVAALKEDKYDFVVVNFANGDMVGHTGIYEAVEKAVVAVDQCVKEVVETAKAVGYETIIIADHGNADNEINSDGTPNTAHSLNPVPFIYVTENKNAKVENGVLADVAPSILHIMGLPQPAEMTGKDLITD